MTYGAVLFSARCAPGDVAERDAAVEQLLARQAEDPFADHVARHLGRAAADSGHLAHRAYDKGSDLLSMLRTRFAVLLAGARAVTPEALNRR